MIAGSAYACWLELALRYSDRLSWMAGAARAHLPHTVEESGFGSLSGLFVGFPPKPPFIVSDEPNDWRSALLEFSANSLDGPGWDEE